MSHYPRAHLLLQRIRDEAHRFAISYHRGVREKALTVSELDAIAGIGPRRRAELQRAFPSLRAMRDASVEELASVPGMNQKAAEAVRAHLLEQMPE